MSFWEVVILVWVMAVAVRPLMKLRPSKRDRQQASFRQRAAEKGLRVTLEAPPRQATDMEAPTRLPVYRQPGGLGATQAWMLMRAAYEHETHFLGSWAWQGKGRASPAEQRCLSEHLPELPPSVRALSGGPQGWSVFWNEKGGEQAFAAVEAVLAALKDCNRLRASTLD